MITINLLPRSLMRRRERARNWVRENYVSRSAMSTEVRESKRATARQRATEQRQVDPDAGRRMCDAGWRTKLKKLGLTEHDYDVLVETQNGRCACCGSEDPQRGNQRHWSVDHDHTTGVVRGLLCSRCNSGIGMLGDCLDGVRCASIYLQSFLHITNIETAHVDARSTLAKVFELPPRHRQTALATRKHTLKNFGLTLEQYMYLERTQDYVCAMCSTAQPGVRARFWFVDHDHQTGRVRGLLCRKCNTGLGLIGDNADRVADALKYLMRSTARAAGVTVSW